MGSNNSTDKKQDFFYSKRLVEMYDFLINTTIFLLKKKKCIKNVKVTYYDYVRILVAILKHILTAALLLSYIENGNKI